MALTLAITGGTGFVGGHALRIARERGHHVRALTRRERPDEAGLTWITGHLLDDSALRRLVDGADAVIHIAGVTNAPTPEGYVEGNVTGTEQLVKAAGTLPLVHVSSLAAREPELSLYGKTKLAGERAAMQAPGRVTAVRPPAVYGPGDKEFLSLFKAARFGAVPMPAKAKASMIYGADLGAALIALAEDLVGDAKSAGRVFEIDDGHGAYPQTQVAELMGDALDRPAQAVELPAAVIKTASAIETLLSKLVRRHPQLSRDRANYIVHPDWGADVKPLLDLKIWQPQVQLAEGLKATAQWYKDQGLL